MPVRYRVCADHVRVDIVGEHTVADIGSLLSTLAADPAVLGSSYLLVNLDQAEPSFRTHEVGPTAALHEPLLRHGLRAVLFVAGRPAVYGVARGFAIQAETYHLPVHVFTSGEEAVRWMADDADSRPA